MALQMGPAGSDDALCQKLFLFSRFCDDLSLSLYLFMFLSFPHSFINSLSCQTILTHNDDAALSLSISQFLNVFVCFFLSHLSAQSTHHDGATDDGLGACQADDRVCDGAVELAVRAGLNVAEIANMPAVRMMMMMMMVVNKRQLCHLP